jgi:hypothetical protein
MMQTSLCCGCGAPLPCDPCARRERLSREKFAGEREAVLRRDEYQCQNCGELAAERILVHHRKPGVQTRRWMITLCRPCHVRAHFLYRASFALVTDSPMLYALWRELHRAQPEQRLLIGQQAHAGEQLVLDCAR